MKKNKERKNGAKEGKNTTNTSYKAVYRQAINCFRHLLIEDKCDFGKCLFQSLPFSIRDWIMPKGEPANMAPARYIIRKPCDLIIIQNDITTAKPSCNIIGKTGDLVG